MTRFLLSDGARQKIESQVDNLFDRLLGRFVGPGPKTISFQITHDPVLSLPGIFIASSVEAGATSANKELLSSLLRISSNYVNGIREHTKAKLLNDVENAIARTGTEGITNVMQELEGQLADMWTKATADIRRIVETEISNASNQGLYDGIAQVTSAMGITNPVVFKVVVKDELLCQICKQLWLMPDGITPRLYFQSELQHGYMTDHKNPFATSGPSHPHCRCTMTLLLKGYGFDSNGLVTWIGLEHNEMTNQRG